MSVTVVAVGAAMPTATRRLCRLWGRCVHEYRSDHVFSSDRLLAETGKRLSVSCERVLEGGVRQLLYRIEDVSAAVAPVGRHDEYAQRLEAQIHHSRRRNKKEMLSTQWTTRDKGCGRKRQVRLVGKWGIEVLIAHLADAVGQISIERAGGNRAPVKPNGIEAGHRRPIAGPFLLILRD